MPRIDARLTPDPVAHVDGGRDELFGRPERGLLADIRALAHRVACLARRLHEPSNVVAVHRRLEDALDPGQPGCSCSDAVHLDVIGMPVPTVVVVDRQHVTAVGSEDLGELLARLGDVGLPEAARIVVRVGALHPRVAVVEEVDLADPECRGRCQHLEGSAFAEALPSVEMAIRHLAAFAAGREHERDIVPVGNRFGDRAPGRNRLVIRMGVKAHQASHHLRSPATQAATGRSSAALRRSHAPCCSAASHDLVMRWRRLLGGLRPGLRPGRTHRGLRRCAVLRGPGAARPRPRFD